MNPLSASVDIQPNPHAAICVPIHISPNRTHTEKCALISQAIRNGNYTATTSVAETLRFGWNATALILQGAIINAINQVCLNATDDQWAAGTYVNFTLHADMPSHFEKLTQWLKAADGIGEPTSEPIPFGTTHLESDFVVIITKDRLDSERLPDSYFFQRAVLSAAQGVELAYILKPINEQRLQALESTGRVVFKVNGCEINASAENLRSAAINGNSNVQSREMYEAVASSFNHALNEFYADWFVNVQLDALQSLTEGAQAPNDAEVVVHYYPKSKIHTAGILKEFILWTVGE